MMREPMIVCEIIGFSSFNESLINNDESEWGESEYEHSEMDEVFYDNYEEGQEVDMEPRIVSLLVTIIFYLFLIEVTIFIYFMCTSTSTPQIPSHYHRN